MSIALLFLGQLTMQAQAFIPYLSENGYEDTAINTAHSLVPRKIDETNILRIAKASKIVFTPLRCSSAEVVGVGAGIGVETACEGLGSMMYASIRRYTDMRC